MGNRYSGLFTLYASRNAWRLLKDGALKRASAIDEEALSTFVEEVEKNPHPAPRQRPHTALQFHGRPPTPHPAQRQHHPHQPPIPNRNPLTNPPTRPSNTRANHLCRSPPQHLPTIRLHFLRLSNGMTTHPPYKLDYHDPNPKLHALSDIRWIVDEKYFFCGLPLHIPCEWSDWDAFLGQGTEEGSYGLRTHAIIDKAIRIGAEGIFSTWLIPPSTIARIKHKIAAILASDAYTERHKCSVRCAVCDFAGSGEL
jgi:hypothetical protein